MITQPFQIQLSVEEATQLREFLAACDAKVEGFRLGVEAVKEQFVQYIAAQHPPQQKEEHKA